MDYLKNYILFSVMKDTKLLDGKEVMINSGLKKYPVQICVLNLKKVIFTGFRLQISIFFCDSTSCSGL